MSIPPVIESWTSKGNFFVIFGELDIDTVPSDDDRIREKVNGVDIFHPNTGEVSGDRPEGIACWLINTDYNEESFFRPPRLLAQCQ